MKTHWRKEKQKTKQKTNTERNWREVKKGLDCLHSLNCHASAVVLAFPYMRFYRVFMQPDLTYLKRRTLDITQGVKTTNNTNLYFDGMMIPRACCIHSNLGTNIVVPVAFGYRNEKRLPQTNALHHVNTHLKCIQKQDESSTNSGVLFHPQHGVIRSHHKYNCGML